MGFNSAFEGLNWI